MISYNSIVDVILTHMLHVGYWCQLIVIFQVEIVTCHKFSLIFSQISLKKTGFQTLHMNHTHPQSNTNQWYYYSGRIHRSTIMIDRIHSYNSNPHIDNWIILQNCQFFNQSSVLECNSRHTRACILILIWLIKHIILSLYM